MHGQGIKINFPVKAGMLFLRHTQRYLNEGGTIIDGAESYQEKLSLNFIKIAGGSLIFMQRKGGSCKFVQTFYLNNLKQQYLNNLNNIYYRYMYQMNSTRGVIKKCVSLRDMVRKNLA